MNSFGHLGFKMRKRVRVCALIIEDDKVLLVAHRYGRRTPSETLWHLPGGKINHEDHQEALKRELREELRLEIKVERQVFQCEETLNNSEVLHFVHLAQRANGGLPVIDREKTSGSEVRFVPIKELDNLTLYPNIGKEIISIADRLPEETVYTVSAAPREWF